MEKNEIIVAQYQVYAGQVTSYEDRAQVTSRLFVTLNVAALSVVLYGLSDEGSRKLPVQYILATVPCAIGFCIVWWLTLRSITRHTTAKHEVLQELEEHLPLQPFRDEWFNKLNGGHRYLRTTILLELFPWVFIVAYCAILVSSLLASA